MSCDIVGPYDNWVFGIKLRITEILGLILSIILNIMLDLLQNDDV
jgi:hypothetical protein